MIKTYPTKEQISTFKMKVAQEDDYVDYVIDLKSLNEETKKELCSLYNIDINELSEKKKLQLSVSSSV